jgi:hypothetical protein
MLKPSNTSLFLVLAGVLFFSACAQKRPILYPNDHLEYVGNEVAQADIDDCIRLAADHGTDSDPVFRQFVEKCLRDKGYEPIGWK